MSVKSLEDVDNLVERLMGGDAITSSASTRSKVGGTTTRPERTAKTVFLGVGATMDMLKASKMSAGPTRENTEEEKRLERALFAKRNRNPDQDELENGPMVTAQATPKKVRQTAVATPLGKRVTTLEDSDSDSDDDEKDDIGSRASAVSRTANKPTPLTPVSAPLLASMAKLEAQKEHQREKRRQKRARRKAKEATSGEVANEVDVDEEHEDVEQETFKEESKLMDEIKGAPSKASQAPLKSQSAVDKQSTFKDMPTKTTGSHQHHQHVPSKSDSKSMTTKVSKPTNSENAQKTAEPEVKQSTDAKLVTTAKASALNLKPGYKAPPDFSQSGSAAVSPARTYREHLVPAGPGKVIDSNTGQKLRIMADGRIKTKKRSKQKNIRKDRRSDDMKPQGDARRELTQETKHRLTQSWD